MDTALPIPGFPEIVAWNGKCRLCALTTRAPELLRQIHSFNRKGYDARRLALETADLWRKRHEAVITQRMFEKHFDDHVDDSDIVQDVTVLLDGATSPRAIGPGAAAGVGPRRSPKTRRMRAEVVGRESAESGETEADEAKEVADDVAESDAEMRAIIRRLQARMEELDDTAPFVDEENQVVKSTVETWLKLVGETRQCLTALHQMRNTERFMKAVLTSYAQRHIQLVSAPLVARFQSLLEELRSVDVPERVLISAETLMKGDVRNILLHAAEESVRESVATYRLH